MVKSGASPDMFCSHLLEKSAGPLTKPIHFGRFSKLGVSITNFASGGMIQVCKEMLSTIFGISEHTPMPNTLGEPQAEAADVQHVDPTLDIDPEPPRTHVKLQAAGRPKKKSKSSTKILENIMVRVNTSEHLELKQVTPDTPFAPPFCTPLHGTRFVDWFSSAYNSSLWRCPRSILLRQGAFSRTHILKNGSI
jgi:hypothetical protein